MDLAAHMGLSSKSLGFLAAQSLLWNKCMSSASVTGNCRAHTEQLAAEIRPSKQGPDMPRF